VIFCLDCQRARELDSDGRCAVCRSGAVDPYLENPFSADELVLLETYKTPKQVLVERFVAGLCIGAMSAIFLILCYIASIPR
jgi:hypothetical protein